VDCGFQSDRPDLGFLGLRHLPAKIQVNSYWISLDFLGFSRPKPAVSIGYAGFLLKEISRALSPARHDLGTAAHDFGPRKGTDWSSGKVTHFLLFCNKLLSTEIAVRRLPNRPFWPPPPKRLALAGGIDSGIAP
jgi:hypothetical protein